MTLRSESIWRYGHSLNEIVIGSEALNSVAFKFVFVLDEFAQQTLKNGFFIVKKFFNVFVDQLRI